MLQGNGGTEWMTFTEILSLGCKFMLSGCESMISGTLLRAA